MKKSILIALMAAVQVLGAAKSFAGTSNNNEPLIQGYCYEIQAEGRTAKTLQKMAADCSKVGIMIADAVSEAAPQLTQEEVFSGLADAQYFFSISNQYYFLAQKVQLE